MKKIIVILLTIVVACGIVMAQQQKETNGPKTTFKTLTHDFGNIKEADGPVTYNFEFTNTGNKPLLIVDVVASCGCTRPEFPTQPIKPGKKGTIKVTYSPIGRPGAFRKSIKVKTNGTERNSTLIISGVVYPKR